MIELGDLAGLSQLWQFYEITKKKNNFRVQNKRERLKI